jgi:hypothetical protein
MKTSSFKLDRSSNMPRPVFFEAVPRNEFLGKSHSIAVFRTRTVELRDGRQMAISCRPNCLGTVIETSNHEFSMGRRNTTSNFRGSDVPRSGPLSSRPAIFFADFKSAIPGITRCDPTRNPPRNFGRPFFLRCEPRRSRRRESSRQRRDTIL